MKRFKIDLTYNCKVLETIYTKPLSEIEAHHFMVKCRKYYSHLVDLYGAENIADYAGEDFANFDEVVKGYGRIWVRIQQLEVLMPVAAKKTKARTRRFLFSFVFCLRNILSPN